MAWIDGITQEDFVQARRQARVSQFLARISRQPNTLLPFDEIRHRLHASGQHYRGFQMVPLEQIVGSESRYSDFDRHFMPLSDHVKDRWLRIGKAQNASVVLPPVDLYKIGDVYFVKDGNHRVSVARQLGQVEIEAYVTELDINVPLSPDVDMRDIVVLEEYNDFLDWTNLHRLRPDQHILFSEPGGYLKLVHHINVHRYYQGLAQGHEISREAAVTNWYDDIYMPVIQVIREQDALSSFSGRTEADLYLWIMDHRWYMREQSDGADPGPQVATADYITLFGRKRLVEAAERFLRDMVASVRTRAGSA